MAEFQYQTPKWLFNSILLGFGQPAQYLSYVYIWYFSYVSIYKDTHTFRTYVWPVVSVGRTVLRAVFTLHLPFNRRQNSTVCGHWTCFPHNPGRSTCLIERTWILFSNFGSGTVHVGLYSISIESILDVGLHWQMYIAVRNELEHPERVWWRYHQGLACVPASPGDDVY